MPVVSECDDSWLSDVLSFPLADDDVAAALDAAAVGLVEEGNVGAGTGMQCFDFKGGIGTASRVLDDDEGGFTVGRPRAHELRQSRTSADRRRAGRTGTDRPDAARASRGIVRGRGRHRCPLAATPAHPHRSPGRPRARHDRFTRLERQRRADDGLLDVEPPRCERGDARRARRGRWAGPAHVRALGVVPRRGRGDGGSGRERAGRGRRFGRARRSHVLRHAGRPRARGARSRSAASPS